MRELVTSGLLALFIAATPLAAMAQVAPLDDETRAAAMVMAQRTAAAVNSNVAPPAGDAIKVDPNTGNDGPVDTPEALPELNLTDLVEYTSLGVTFLAPADWIVETDLTGDTAFVIEVPGTEIFMSLETDSGLDFPSWLGVALFRSQTDLLLNELGEGAVLEESATIFTDQNLPMAKLAFSGVDGGEDVSGALYVLAPNQNAYLIFAGGPTEQWRYAAPGAQLIAESLVFDDELITVTQADDESLDFVDEDAATKVTIPAQWYVMSTGDEKFPLMAAEPEVRFVAAIGTEASFGGDFDINLLQAFIPEGSTIDDADAQALIDGILEMLDTSGSPILVDEEASTVIPRDGAVTVKLVGEAELDQGLTMPVILYIDLRQAGIGIVTIFGDTESALLVEEDIQLMLESVTGL